MSARMSEVIYNARFLQGLPAGGRKLQGEGPCWPKLPAEALKAELAGHPPGGKSCTSILRKLIRVSRKTIQIY